MYIKTTRFKEILIKNISKLLKLYSSYLLVFFVFMLIGFITGILTASKYSELIECEHLINKYLYRFLLNDINFLSYFFSVSIILLIIFICIICFTRNKFCIGLNFLLTLIISYIFGFDLYVVFISLGFAGIVLGIIVYSFIGFSIFILIIFIQSFVCKNCIDSKKSCLILSKSDCRKVYLICIFLSFLMIFIWSILFSTIHIFVIVD